jgi:hypothetical protein
MRLSAMKPSLRNGHQRLIAGVVCLCLAFLGISPNLRLRAEDPKARRTLQGHTNSVHF